MRLGGRPGSVDNTLIGERWLISLSTHGRAVVRLHWVQRLLLLRLVDVLEQVAIVLLLLSHLRAAET